MTETEYFSIMLFAYLCAGTITLISFYQPKRGWLLFFQILSVIFFWPLTPTFPVICWIVKMYIGKPRRTEENG